MSINDPPYHPTSTPSYHPTSTPSCHLTSIKDSTKGSTGEVSKPAEEPREASPPKTNTQHSQTSDSNREEEEHPIIRVDEDTNISEAEEDVQEKLNDASPYIPDQAQDTSDDDEE